MRSLFPSPILKRSPWKPQLRTKSRDRKSTAILPPQNQQFPRRPSLRSPQARGRPGTNAVADLWQGRTPFSDFTFAGTGRRESSPLVPRPLLLRPLIDPVVDRLVPELRVLRLHDPMAFVGKVEHLRRHAHGLQRGEELEAFADVEAIVELGMNHQRRRLEILGRIARIPLLVHLRIRVWRALEFPVVEPEFFGRAPRGDGIEH